MTSYMASTAAIRMCSAALAARPGALAGHAGLAAPSTVTAGTSQSWQPELGKRSHKRFAMAGIDTNVWPLGPEDWSSG